MIHYWRPTAPFQLHIKLKSNTDLNMLKITTTLSTGYTKHLVRSTWSPGGVLPMWWVIHMCRGFDPLFSLWQDRARSFWGIFSHPPTPKRSFVVLKLPILTDFDLLGPKFHFSLDLFGSNFQRPAAHTHHFSDRVPPPGPDHTSGISASPAPVVGGVCGFKRGHLKSVGKWCALEGNRILSLETQIPRVCILAPRISTNTVT